MNAETWFLYSSLIYNTDIDKVNSSIDADKNMITWCSLEINMMERCIWVRSTYTVQTIFTLINHPTNTTPFVRLCGTCSALCPARMSVCILRFLQPDRLLRILILKVAYLYTLFVWMPLTMILLRRIERVSRFRIRLDKGWARIKQRFPMPLSK